MGIKNTVILQGGVVLTNAYLNIDSYLVEKQAKLCTVYLSAYKDQAACTSGEKPLSYVQMGDQVHGTMISHLISNHIEEIDGEEVEVNDFDTYLSDAVLKEDGVSIEGNIYTYLKTLDQYQSFADVV